MRPAKGCVTALTACGASFAGYTLNILTFRIVMTEEQKEARKLKKREYAKALYLSRKDDPEFKAKRASYRKRFMERNVDRVRAKAREYYHDNQERIKEYHRKYYEEHKEKMRQRAKEWKEKNPERFRELIERRKERIKQEKEAKKELPPSDKIAAIFKNPAAAQHYKWLMQKRGKINKESEVEHEVTK